MLAMPAIRVHVQNEWYEKGLLHAPDVKADQGIKYQDISYFKQDGKISVGMRKMVPTDFQRANSEISSLGHGWYHHFIGFRNNRTAELVQFSHYEEGKWYADVPIYHGTGWEGYVWGCRTDMKSVLNTAGLFFEELPWFDSLQFMMNRMPQS